MDRRKKGSGQITHVPGRKSPWRASVVDSAGKQKSRFFKTEKESYEKYWDDIAPFIKFGCLKDEKFQEKKDGKTVLFITNN